MSTRTRLPSLCALVFAGCFFLLLGIAYGIPGAGRLDATALDGLESLNGPLTTPIAHFLSHLADPPAVVAIVGALALVGLKAGRRRQAVAACAFVPLAVVAAEVLKLVLAHPRVAPELSGSEVKAAAFPSGHATAAMAVALAAVLVAPPRWRPVAGLAGAVYAMAVCTAILILGWHFPSDVFGGMLLAALCFSAAVVVLRSREDRRAAPPAPSEWVRSASRHVREVGAVAALAALAALAAGAESLASFASDHTTATVAAVAVVACSTLLVAAGGLIADR